MKPVIYILFFLFNLALSTANADEPALQTLHKIPEKPLAPEFILYDIDDNPHKLSDFHGKTVVINFWATWCPPCRYEIPSMERLQEKIKNKDIIILAINIGEDAETIFEFIKDYNINFPILMDIDSSITKKYPVIGLPTSYIIDSEGRIVYRAIGSREWDSGSIIEKLKSVNVAR